MIKKTLFSSVSLFALAFLLVGCSTANRMGGWLKGDGEPQASEVAYVPPSTAAPQPQTTSVYQSESYRPSNGTGSSSESSDWGLEGIEPPAESNSIFNQAVGDIGYVSTPSPNLPGGSNVAAMQQAPVPAPVGIYRGGNPAPRIYGTTFDGQTFDSAQHLGRVLLVDFWFRKCGPCVRALPKVDQLRKTYPKDKLSIVAVNNDTRKSTAVAFLNRNPHDWPQIFAPSSKPNLVATYGVKLFPTFVVIDQLGNIQYQGSSIASASAKVAELIEIPSLPQNAAPAGFVASGNRPG